jgi:hypothetical protein
VVQQRGGLFGRRNQNVVINGGNVGFGAGGGQAVRIEQRGGLFGLGRRQTVTIR